MLAWALWMPVFAAIVVPWWCATWPGATSPGTGVSRHRHLYLGLSLFVAGALILAWGLGPQPGSMAGICLLAESSLLASVVFALRSGGGPRIIVQGIATALGLAACLTPLWTNSLVLLMDGSPGVQREIVRFAIAANPVLVIANSAAGIDLLRGPHTYTRSLLGASYYEYPSWGTHAGALAGGALLLTLGRLWAGRVKA